MQSSEETRLEQQSPDDGAAASASDEGVIVGGPKKASKKKASKKKASKKKASKKKASKKKASKKKRGKKKVSRAAATESPWDRIAQAAEDLRAAAMELAEREASQGRRALDDFVGATREKLSDIEAMAERGIARLTGKR